jgi:hypothetical protein
MPAATAWAARCCATPHAAPVPAARPGWKCAGHRTEAHAFYRACGFSDGAVRFVKSLGD